MKGSDQSESRSHTRRSSQSSICRLRVELQGVDVTTLFQTAVYRNRQSLDALGLSPTVVRLDFRNFTLHANNEPSRRGSAIVIKDSDQVRSNFCFGLDDNLERTLIRLWLEAQPGRIDPDL